MTDNVIKNPNRIARPQVPYETEYKRKGIVVKEAPTRTIADSIDNSAEMFATIDGSANIDADGNEVPFENGHVIDNNDYVNIGYTSIPVNNERREQKSEEISSPDVGNYILMVFGKLIASGSIDKIEAKVKDIMYGDDPSFIGLEISMDDIVVLKRVAIKVGIFIER